MLNIIEIKLSQGYDKSMASPLPDKLRPVTQTAS